MPNKSKFGLFGVVLFCGISLFLFQNCSSGNKDLIDLSVFSKGTSSAAITGPILLTFANNTSGGSVDTFVSGASSNIYATVVNSGSTGQICIDAGGNCLSAYPSAWKALSADGWTQSGNTWTKTYPLNSCSGCLTTGAHRIYFARPGPNPAAADNYASVDFTIQ